MSARRGSNAAPEFTVANPMIKIESRKSNDAPKSMRIDSGTNPGTNPGVNDARNLGPEI